MPCTVQNTVQTLENTLCFNKEKQKGQSQSQKSADECRKSWLEYNKYHLVFNFILSFYLYRNDEKEYALKQIEGTGISMSACREIAVSNQFCLFFFPRPELMFEDELNCDRTYPLKVTTFTLFPFNYDANFGCKQKTHVSGMCRLTGRNEIHPVLEQWVEWLSVWTLVFVFNCSSLYKTNLKCSSLYFIIL